ncbi:MAG: hypothetical protein AB7E32_09955 [Desulfovibrio sp.]
MPEQNAPGGYSLLGANMEDRIRGLLLGPDLDQPSDLDRLLVHELEGLSPEELEDSVNAPWHALPGED